METFVLAGMFISSHNEDVIEKSEFWNVRLEKPVMEGVDGYQALSPSRLEILDIESGNREVIYETEKHIEAPNWSRNGKWLAYCAERDGNYDVYKIQEKGGNEIRLTLTEGLDDGPEYSPDGKYIIFISYPPEVPANSHSHNKRMMLRLMPVDGAK